MPCRTVLLSVVKQPLPLAGTEPTTSILKSEHLKPKLSRLRREAAVHNALRQRNIHRDIRTEVGGNKRCWRNRLRSFTIRTPYQDDQVKVNYTGGCVPCTGGKKGIRKNQKEACHLQDLGIDGRLVSNGT
jgi:hypothetical protein